jgi:hypothetical protein
MEDATMFRGLAAMLLVAMSASVLHAQDRTDLWRSYVEHLPANTLVVVVLKNGKSFRGHVVRVTEDSVVLLRKTRLAVPPSTFALDDVESIEPQKETWSPGAKVLVGVGSAAGVLFTLFVIALAGTK